MNNLVLAGNIAGDIYLNQTAGHPLLRLLLYSGHPRVVKGLRIVLLDGKAKQFYAALRKGSEIGVIGHIITRRHDRNFVTEIEARNLVLVRNFSWADIDTLGTFREQFGGRVIVEGTVGTSILFEWRQRTMGKFLSVNDQYAFLKFDLFTKIYPDGLNIFVFGFLAEMIFPYLRPTSVIAVDGVLRQDARGRRVVAAENIALLRNIDYVRAAAAQSRLAQMGEIDEQELIE